MTPSDWLRAPTLSVLTALLCAAAAADAATIYRCGPLRNAFSDLPCTGGQAFEADDARSDAQRADALRSTAMDRRLAADLQRERLRAAALPPPGAAVLATQPRASTAPVLLVERRHPRKPRPAQGATTRWVDEREHFIAFEPTAAGKPHKR